MKLYLSARVLETLDPRPGFEQFVELAAEAGYDGVGVRVWQVAPDVSPQQIAGMARTLARAGLLVCSVTSGPETLEQVIAAAQTLGAAVVQSGPPGELAARAPLLKPGMEFGVQMHTGGTFETIESTARALAGIDTPLVGAIVEPGNSTLAGETEWGDGFFMPLAGRIAGCHVQGIVTGRGESSLQLRDGATVRYERVLYEDNDQVDYARFFDALRATGYDGFVNVIEPPRADMPLGDFLRGCAEFLRAVVS